jgi:hypothetical protein
MCECRVRGKKLYRWWGRRSVRVVIAVRRCHCRRPQPLSTQLALPSSLLVSASLLASRRWPPPHHHSPFHPASSSQQWLGVVLPGGVLHPPIRPASSGSQRWRWVWVVSSLLWGGGGGFRSVGGKLMVSGGQRIMWVTYHIHLSSIWVFPVVPSLGCSPVVLPASVVFPPHL